MSVYCPVLGRNVVYLECIECEDKKCKEVEYNNNDKNNENKEKTSQP